jgi:hypothetical protein
MRYRLGRIIGSRGKMLRVASRLAQLFDEMTSSPLMARSRASISA